MPFDDPEKLHRLAVTISISGFAAAYLLEKSLRKMHNRLSLVLEDEVDMLGKAHADRASKK
ncbi:MAG: hypothetical protein U1E59_19535 [Amaricoccus sp.]